MKFCYVAICNEDNSYYLRELVCSALSVREHNPEAVIRVLTNQPLNLPFAYLFDEIIPCVNTDKDILSRVSLGTYDVLDSSCPCIFIDTDVIVLDDLTQVFENDEFDIAGTIANHRTTYQNLNKLPSSEAKKNCGLNSGLLWIRNHEVVKTCKRYLNAHFHEKSRYHRARIPDQAALHDVLTDHDYSVLTLPSNYNLRLCEGAAISGKVYAVHAHFVHHYKGFANLPLDSPLFLNHCEKIISRVKKINHSMESRVYPPSKKRAHVDDYWLKPFKII